jgi:hypothetical protein
MTAMAEEKGKSDGKEPGLSFGSLVLFALVGIIALQLLGFPFPGIAIPFAALAALWYGETHGFGVGLISVLFGELVVFSWNSKTLLNAIIAGFFGIFGKGAHENDFVVRVLLASVLFEVIFQLNNADFVFDTDYYAGQWPIIALHLSLNAVIAIFLSVKYLRPKE